MSVPKCEYRRSVVIDAPIAQVFAFHAEPRNIPKITPSWQPVRILFSQPAVPGGEFVIEARLFWIVALRWRGVWRTVKAPTLLVDEALQSPFRSWQHQHHFEALSNRRTLMTDHVTYQLAGGWMGKWLGETLGRLQFVVMFADRQRRTAKWLNAHPLG